MFRSSPPDIRLTCGFDVPASEFGILCDTGNFTTRVVVKFPRLAHTVNRIGGPHQIRAQCQSRIIHRFKTYNARQRPPTQPPKNGVDMGFDTRGAGRFITTRSAQFRPAECSISATSEFATQRHSQIIHGTRTWLRPSTGHQRPAFSQPGSRPRPADSTSPTGARRWDQAG